MYIALAIGSNLDFRTTAVRQFTVFLFLFSEMIGLEYKIILHSKVLNSS